MQVHPHSRLGVFVCVRCCVQLQGAPQPAAPPCKEGGRSACVSASVNKWLSARRCVCFRVFTVLSDTRLRSTHLLIHGRYAMHHSVHGSGQHCGAVEVSLQQASSARAVVKVLSPSRLASCEVCCATCNCCQMSMARALSVQLNETATQQMLLSATGPASHSPHMHQPLSKQRVTAQLGWQANLHPRSHRR